MTPRPAATTYGNDNPWPEDYGTTDTPTCDHPDKRIAITRTASWSRQHGSIPAVRGWVCNECGANLGAVIEP